VRSKRRKRFVGGMNCEAEQETSLSISFQWDSLLAGEQEAMHGAGVEDSRAGVSLPPVLGVLFCKELIPGREVKEPKTFHRAVNHGRARKLIHVS